jgi:hypothetical protein
MTKLAYRCFKAGLAIALLECCAHLSDRSMTKLAYRCFKAGLAIALISIQQSNQISDRHLRNLEIAISNKS